MKQIILLLAAALALTACRSSRDAAAGPAASLPAAGDAAAGTVPSANKAALKFGRRLEANRQKAATVTAKVSMDISADGRNVSVGGTLRMKRDDVVQLSLTFLGFEVGRMEFTPAEVLIVDRVNKQYVRAAYDQVSFLRQAGLDFRALQSLFWAEVFAPGQAEPPYGRFTVSEAGGHTLLTLTDAPGLEYSFLALTDKARLDRVTVEPKAGADRGRFVWRYADYAQLGGRPFPATMKAELKAAGKAAGFSMQLSRLNNADGWETRTRLSDKYTRRAADDLLRRLFSSQDATH